MLRGNKGMDGSLKAIIAGILFAAFSLLPLLSSGAGEIYQWKDQEGKTHFSDTPPPGGEVKIKQVKEEPAGNPKTKTDPPSLKSTFVEEKRPNRDINVVMYMTSWCGFCKKARQYLQTLNVNLEEYDIEKDSVRAGEMMSKSGGSRGIPLIDIEGIVIQGYNPGAIKAAVEKRRNL
jgi:glutaredoxin